MAVVLAFAGSNSSKSVNYKLVKYTSSLINDREVSVLNMANYPFPMYSEDHEREHGFSNSLTELRDDIKNAAGLIISVNEHNGSPSAYFKNVVDWLSRLERGFLNDKKIFLMAASPGKRGAKGSLELVSTMFTRFGAQIVSSFSLPSFYEHFDANEGIKDNELAQTHKDALASFLAAL